MNFKKSSIKCKVCVKRFSVKSHEKRTIRSNAPNGPSAVFSIALRVFSVHILFKLLRGLYQHLVKAVRIADHDSAAQASTKAIWEMREEIHRLISEKWMVGVIKM